MFQPKYHWVEIKYLGATQNSHWQLFADVIMLFLNIHQHLPQKLLHANVHLKGWSWNTKKTLGDPGSNHQSRTNTVAKISFFAWTVIFGTWYKLHSTLPLTGGLERHCKPPARSDFCYFSYKKSIWYAWNQPPHHYFNL